MSKFKVGDWVVRVKNCKGPGFNFMEDVPYRIDKVSEGVYGQVVYLFNVPSNWDADNFKLAENVKVADAVAEYTGGSVSYYKLNVKKPSGDIEVECNDIIKALKMSYCEGNAFKAIWRSCAARNLGLAKKGYDEGLYDAEKVVFFGNDMIEAAKQAKESK